MIAALAIAAAMSHPGPAPAADVTMPGRAFAPAAITVLAGETVTWRNDGGEDHTVRGDGFDSGVVPAGGTYARTFETPGSHRYVCTIHRTMKGRIDVVALALEGPRAPVARGDTVTLEARVPVGAERVTLERLGDGAVAEAVPDAEGRARFTVHADAPGRYRVRAGALTSAVVTVRIAAAVTAEIRRHGSLISVSARVAPNRPGGRAVLEHYVRERFAWLPLQRTRWAGGTAPIRFDVHSRRRPRLRVRIPAARGGWAEAVSTGARPRVPPHGHG
jgi:plastocyanin